MWAFGKYPYPNLQQRHTQLLRLSRVLDTLPLNSLQALSVYRSAPRNGTNNITTGTASRPLASTWLQT